MLQRSLGTIPIAPALAGNADVQTAALKLESIQTHSGILVDTMGFGKTNTALLFLSYLGLFAAGKARDYQPALVLVPSGIVLHQWEDAITKHYPHLQLITAHGGSPSTITAATRWVSATAMNGAPKSLKNWPGDLTEMLILEDKDERILSSQYVYSPRASVL